MMRILMLIAHPNIKGPLPKYTPYLVGGLRALGCDLATEPWGRRQEDEAIITKVIQRFADIARILKRLSGEKLDVLIIKTAHDWATLSRDLPLVLAARPLCHHVILQFHGSDPGRCFDKGQFAFRLASKLLVRLVDGTMVLSREEERQWQRLYPGGKFFPVANPFLPGKSEEVPSVTDNWGLPPETPVLLFVGRLIREKGIFDLFEAAASLKEQQRFHLLVAGDGPGAAKARKLIETLKLSDWVTLVGYLQGERLAAAYKLADLFVLPTYREGFPMVLAEAMAAGLPIITTRLGGIADHLQESVNAVFVALRDPTALGRALASLLSDPKRRAAMGRANAMKVKEFSPAIVSRHYLETIQRIVS